MGALVEGPHRSTAHRIVIDGRGTARVDAIHAVPDVRPALGLVVHPDIMGVRPLFDDMCQRIATHGIVVCAPEPFARLPAEQRAALDAAGRMEHVKDLRDDEQLGDLERAADYLTATDSVSEVAVLGFCMGGMYALKAGARGRFTRSVVFYGMLRVPEAWRGPAVGEPLTVAADVCPTLALFGDCDPWVPAADVATLQEAWATRPDCEVVVYAGADHGFVHDPDRPAHRAADAADAWHRTLAFLGVA